MISAVFISTLSAISIYLIVLLRIEKSKVRWFEDFGREYLEKHRDEARRDGLTK
jgi:hypothetical protein